MPILYKVLGQENPSTNVLTTIYQVPSGANTVVSTINICNQSTNNTTFGIAVAPGNAAVGFKNYIAWRTPIPYEDSIALTVGVTLSANDAIQILASNANVSFAVFGSEIYT